MSHLRIRVPGPKREGKLLLYSSLTSDETEVSLVGDEGVAHDLKALASRVDVVMDLNHVPEVRLTLVGTELEIEAELVDAVLTALETEGLVARVV